MSIDLVDLATLTDATLQHEVVLTLGRWHVDEWGGLYSQSVWNAAIAEAEFMGMSQPGSVDRTLLAFEPGQRTLGALLGSISLLATDDLAGWEHVGPWLASLYVVPNARGRGVGGSLTAACLATAAARGDEYLHLFTEGQEQYYLDRGWRTIGTAQAHGSPVAVMVRATSPFGARQSVTTEWNTNELFGGAYSSIRPGGSPADRDALATAVVPGLWLAGEYTWSAGPGTLHGAWFSGERAADGLLAELGSPGATESTDPIAVVGAGLAGIAAARRLADAGRRVILVEAGARPGGRAATDRTLGGPVHLGGAWLHGPVGHPATDAVTAVPWELDRSTFVVGHGQLAPDDLARLDEIATGIDLAAERAPSEAAVGPALRAAIAEVDLSAQDAAVIGSWFRMAYESQYAAPPDELSLRWAEEEYHLPGGNQLITSGLDAFVDERIVGLDLRCSATATAIIRTGDGWRLELGGGSSIDATAVICATPLPPVRDGLIRFDPPLPDSTRQHLSRLGCGPVAKVFATFDEPFWGDLRCFHLADPDGPGPLELWVDVSALTGRPTLNAFAVGDDAEQVERMTQDERCRLVDRELRRAGVTPTVRHREATT